MLKMLAIYNFYFSRLQMTMLHFQHGSTKLSGTKFSDRRGAELTGDETQV